MIPKADAIGNPWAMVVHLQDARATSMRAVMGTGRLNHATFLAQAEMFASFRRLLTNQYI
jgi:hypothetical protein